MTTVLLLRHGRTTANAAGVLAGDTPGVDLDEAGVEQARAVAERLAGLTPARVVTSPLERCRHTAALAVPDAGDRLSVDDRLTECGYGAWTGRALADLAGEPLWAQVQSRPSAVCFPNGEPLAAMSARAVAAVREWDARVAAEAGPGAVWVAVSHGDVIKAILADALGLHLDQFQRLLVDPASVSVLRFEPSRVFVVAMNTTAGSLAHLAPAPDQAAAGDVQVGGGLGSRG